MSYSLYLIHKPVYGLVEWQWGEVLEGRGVVAFLAYGIASLLAAAVLHYAVERPALQLRDRVLRRLPATASPGRASSAPLPERHA